MVLLQQTVSSLSVPQALLDQSYFSHPIFVDKSLHHPTLLHQVQIILPRRDAMPQTNLAVSICALWPRRWLPCYLKTRWCLRVPDIKILMIFNLGSQSRIMTKRMHHRKRQNNLRTTTQLRALLLLVFQDMVRKGPFSSIQRLITSSVLSIYLPYGLMHWIFMPY